MIAIHARRGLARLQQNCVENISTMPYSGGRELDPE